MTSTAKRREVIEAIRRETEASRGERIWNDYVNALKLISQVVFTRSTGFMMELIQNAEDAGKDVADPGWFRISINETRVKVTHNAQPFSEGDVRALCGIRSSKKPERGTLGYLGIGFKSVFKITDSPEIYSNGFQFRFDRNAWEKPSEMPWHVLPIWIEKPSEEDIRPEETTFVFPFREKSAYETLVEDASRLGTELYLFLRWLRTIEFIDENQGTKLSLQNLGEKDGVTVLRQGDEDRWFKFFRKEVEVPEWVKQDRLTQEYRANVKLREIAIAFPLDEQGNLAPSEATAMYGGVYSFVPLGESRSGVRFPVQADFLVQPGRDAINYESAWNRWLLDEVVDLCKTAIKEFKQHDVWKYQFMPAFQFSKENWLESHQKLFGPHLIEPLEKFLENDACIPTQCGGWALPKDAVRMGESVQATDALVRLGLIAADQIARVFGSRENLKLADARFLDRKRDGLVVVDRSALLANTNYLQQHATANNAAEWFRALYRWLNENPVEEVYYPSSGRGSRSGLTRNKGYYDVPFVLTSDSTLHLGGKVRIPDSPTSLPTLSLLEELTNSPRQILHPDILAGASDNELRDKLRGFLMGLAGVQLLDIKVICREEILPKILTSSSPPDSTETLLRLTSCCQMLLGSDLGEGNALWCMTKDVEIKHADEVLLAAEFTPELDWETHGAYVAGLNFVSQRYIRNPKDEAEVRAWRAFFRAGGVKDQPNRGVEEFAVKFATEKLQRQYKSVSAVEARNYGYDLDAKDGSGQNHHIEVKGLSVEGDIELTPNETEAADRYKRNYYLCVVTGIPNSPQMYFVMDPAGVGRKDKLTIPASVWKQGANEFQGD
jgi:hypothetical protein